MIFHKITAKILLFFILTLFPVLLPLFSVSGASPFTNWDFPFQVLCLAVFALVLILWNPELYKKSEIENDRKIPLFKKLIIGFSVFVILNIVSLVLQKAGKLFSKVPEMDVIKPEFFKSWIFCILNFFFSSFYEETVYRFFLPEALIYFTRNCKDQRMAEIDCEILGMILFALGHVYLGILSVINAALAYIALRFCFKKTESIIPGTLAHFAYNLLQLIISPL